MTEESPRSLIGKLVAYLINSQITILLIVGLMVLGIMAIAFTPKEENPQIRHRAKITYSSRTTNEKMESELVK